MEAQLVSECENAPSKRKSCDESSCRNRARIELAFTRSVAGHGPSRTRVVRPLLGRGLSITAFAGSDVSWRIKGLIDPEKPKPKFMVLMFWTWRAVPTSLAGAFEDQERPGGCGLARPFSADRRHSGHVSKASSTGSL